MFFENRERPLWPNVVAVLAVIGAVGLLYAPIFLG
jgi:hypothetical protein